VETKNGIDPGVYYGGGHVHEGSTVPYDVPNNAGPGFVLRATDQNYGRIPASTSYSPGTQNFTFSVNFRQDTFSSEYASTNTSGEASYFTPLLSMQGGDFREGAVLGINNLSQEVFWNVQAGAYTESTVTRASAPFAENLLQQWNNVTAVWNRDQAKAEIWLNGIQVANVDAKSTSPIEPTWDMLLGAYQYSSARGGYSSPVRSGDVYMDNVRIYNRALSPDEIAELNQIDRSSTTPISLDQTNSESVYGSTKTRSGGFDKGLPTYVITHGWQRDDSYERAGWNFGAQPRPEGQANIGLEVWNRMFDEGLDANIVFYEWEGAYTGQFGAPKARHNADFAGYRLGRKLTGILGSDYDQDLHFIGHSYGTIVNGIATRYLERWGDIDAAAAQQFTTLDAPTNALGFIAPNFTESWFEFVLPDDVDYFDNYFSTLKPLQQVTWGGYGEIIGAADLNQVVGFGHGAVGSEFYPDFIRRGVDADFGSVSGYPIEPTALEAIASDWITPLLPAIGGLAAATGGESPDQVGAFATPERTVRPFGSLFEPLIGQPELVGAIPGYDEFRFDGYEIAEQSPVSMMQLIDIPLGTEMLLLDWMVGVGGDGDWFTLYFGDELLWSMGIDGLLEGLLLDAVIDVSGFAGMSGALTATLHSVGESNAVLYVGNLRFAGTFGAAPVPAPLLLMAAGLLALAAQKHHRARRLAS